MGEFVDGDAGGSTEFGIPRAELEGFVEAGEGGVGWIDHSGAGELAMEEGVEMSDQIGFADNLGLMFHVPSEGGDADAAGEWAVAGDIQESFHADAVFEIAGDLNTAAILVGDDAGEGFAVTVHGDPGGGHDGEADGINSFGGAAKIGDGAGDGLEKVGGIDLDLGAVEMRGIGGARDGAEDSSIADDAGFDGRGTAVEAEDLHGGRGGYTAGGRL